MTSLDLDWNEVPLKPGICFIWGGLPETKDGFRVVSVFMGRDPRHLHKDVGFWQILVLHFKGENFLRAQNVLAVNYGRNCILKLSIHEKTFQVLPEIDTKQIPYSDYWSRLLPLAHYCYGETAGPSNFGTVDRITINSLGVHQNAHAIRLLLDGPDASCPIPYSRKKFSESYYNFHGNFIYGTPIWRNLYALTHPNGRRIPLVEPFEYDIGDCFLIPTHAGHFGVAQIISNIETRSDTPRSEAHAGVLIALDSRRFFSESQAIQEISDGIKPEIYLITDLMHIDYGIWEKICEQRISYAPSFPRFFFHDCANDFLRHSTGFLRVFSERKDPLIPFLIEEYNQAYQEGLRLLKQAHELPDS